MTIRCRITSDCQILLPTQEPDPVPATTTKTKAKTPRPAGRRTAKHGDPVCWLNEAGQLEWHCPRCHTNHPEHARACNTCEYVRPRLDKLQRVEKPPHADFMPTTQAEAQAKEDAAADRGEPTEKHAIPREHIAALYDSYSADKLASPGGTIRPPVEIGDRLFLCTGAQLAGGGGLARLWFYELVDPDVYAAEYADQPRPGVHHGRQVSDGHATYVIIGPRFETPGYHVGKVDAPRKPKTAKAPAGEPDNATVAAVLDKLHNELIAAAERVEREAAAALAELAPAREEILKKELEIRTAAEHGRHEIQAKLDALELIGTRPVTMPGPEGPAAAESGAARSPDRPIAPGEPDAPTDHQGGPQNLAVTTAILDVLHAGTWLTQDQIEVSIRPLAKPTKRPLTDATRDALGKLRRAGKLQEKDGKFRKAKRK